jgi:hypothetical protein
MKVNGFMASQCPITLRSMILDLGGPSACVSVVVVSAWLAAPSQSADHHHVFFGGATAQEVAHSTGLKGSLVRCRATTAVQIDQCDDLIATPWHAPWSRVPQRNASEKKVTPVEGATVWS